VIPFQVYGAPVDRRRGACGGRSVEAMRRGVGMVAEAIIREVSHCLREGGKVWDAFGPTQWQGQRKADERIFIFVLWENNSEFWHIARVNVDSVETVGNIDHQ